MMEIAGLTALVTGGASGIGLAAARALARRGARPMLADLDLPRAEAAAAALRAEGAVGAEGRIDWRKGP